MRQPNLSIAVILLVVLLLGVYPADAEDSLFSSMFDAGSTALREGRFAEAIKKLKSALKEAEFLPLGDSRLRNTLKALAQGYEAEKKYDLAEPLLRRVIEIDTKSGDRSSDVVSSASALALNLRNQSRFKESIATYLSVLGSEEKPDAALGEDARITLLINLAGVYSDMSDYKQGERNLRNALNLAEKSRTDTVLLARALEALALLYDRLGRYDEASSLLARALKVDQRVEPDGGIETSGALLSMGRFLREQGKTDEALDYINRSVKMRKKILGDQHANVIESALELARLYEDVNAYKDAASELEGLRPILEQTVGDESPRYAEFLRQLASDYMNCSQYGRAEPLLRRSLSIDEASFGKDGAELALDLNALGMFYVFQGQYADAEPLYRRALSITERKSGLEHPDVAACLNNLAWLYDNQRKFSEARPLIEKGLAIREKALGKDHPVVARNLHNLAKVCIEEDKLDEAQRLLEQALKIQKDALGANHPDTIATMSDLADLMQKSKRFAEAEELYKKLLAFDEVAEGKGSATVAADLELIAHALVEQDRADEAKTFIARAKTIKATLPGSVRDDHQSHGLAIASLQTIKVPPRIVADKWALVVGISNFKDSTINLQYAAKDAMDFRNYLIFEANFRPDHVKLLLDQNATRDNIVGHLGEKWLKKVARNEDLVVIYVSSHGTSARKEIGDANFIVAYETNLSNAVLSGIPMQWFTTGIKDMINCQRVVIIMDVCHGGALRSPSTKLSETHTQAAAGPGSKTLIRHPDLSPRSGLNIGSGQIVLASSESDQVSWESKSYPNGVFTRQLIEALRTKGEATPLMSAFKQMRNKVEQEVLRSRSEIQTPIMVATDWHGGDIMLGVKPQAPRLVETKGGPSSVLPTKKPPAVKKTTRK
ncbi:MAG: tetratricopeptide repeat protein [Candidatus Obscuribacterales bacterium]|nr:tetratricopeptide repeat protein [Candidatus Obscuribacterales bacterium]